jgi:tripartite-type tricarboxylate transporter receptor subunit TctC
MTKPIGTNFVVENRPSNGGILAPSCSPRRIRRLHHPHPPHRHGDDPGAVPAAALQPAYGFEYIGLINEVPMTLIGRANLPPSNLKDLLAYVKANSAKMSLANAGIGARSHLCGMLFQSAIQVDLLTVPYKGTGPAMNDLLGGQVDFMCDQTTSTTAQIKAGKVKVYGVTTLKRVPSLPTCRRWTSRA